MFKSKFTKFVLTSMLAAGLGASIIAMSACNKEEPPQNPTSFTIEDATAVVYGYEWGAGIPQMIVKFSDNVAGVEKDTFSISMSYKSFGMNKKADRVITGISSCDENGNKITGDSKFVLFEMSVAKDECSPLTAFTSTYEWANNRFTLTVNEGKTFSVGQTVYDAGDKGTANLEKRIIPQTEKWVKGTYHYTENGKTTTLTHALWSPESDSEKNPLIIWLHGLGEGGTDIDFALLGNEVTALTAENDTNVQKYFKDGESEGAYVLAVQTPTRWMDDGNGNMNNTEGDGKQSSLYTEALFNAIKHVVESNEDIDASRIYLGGCSNGGYMTMDLMFEHGDYFAAYYPLCEGYLNSRISDEMIEATKNYNVWFVCAENDTTLPVANYTVPTYYRYLQAGANNMHLTLKSGVAGADGDEYIGHFVWVSAFNDDIKTQIDSQSVTALGDLIPANCTKSGNMWQWLAQQVKA